MQAELETEYPQYDIQILAVNQVGNSSGASLVASHGDLPMVQNNTTDDIWNTWHALAPNPSTHSGAPYRDVHILNTQNEIVYTYSLTLNNLSNPQNFATLKQMFVDAATQ